MNYVHLDVDGRTVAVPEGANVAAAVATLDRPMRRSVQGECRAPVCGMGLCFECRVTVDGIPHVRGCLTLAREGMQVITDG